MEKNIITDIRQELRSQVDESTKSRFQSFFKENVTFYGVKTGSVNKIAREHFKDIKDFSKKEIFSLCEDLLKSDY